MWDDVMYKNILYTEKVDIYILGLPIYSRLTDLKKASL